MSLTKWWWCNGRHTGKNCHYFQASVECSKLKTNDASFDIVFFSYHHSTICFIVCPPPLIDEQRLRTNWIKGSELQTQGLTMTFFWYDNMMYIYMFMFIHCCQVCLDMYIICFLQYDIQIPHRRTFFLKPRLVVCKSRFGPSSNCHGSQPDPCGWDQNYCWCVFRNLARKPVEVGSLSHYFLGF